MSPQVRTYDAAESLTIAGGHAEDPVLAALLNAPVVRFTDEERAMIAEVKQDTRPWTPAAEFIAKVAALASVG